MLNINKISITARNMDKLGPYEKVEGSVDVVIMQMAAMLLWLGLGRWRIILWLHFGKFNSVGVILHFLFQTIDLKYRKNWLKVYPSFARVTVDSYFRGSTRLAELVRRAGSGVLVYTPHRYTMFQLNWTIYQHDASTGDTLNTQPSEGKQNVCECVSPQLFSRIIHFC